MSGSGRPASGGVVLPMSTLNVSVPSGGGTVTSDDGKIDCPPTCTFTYLATTRTVTLTPVAGPDHVFGRWSHCPTQNGMQCVVKFKALVNASVSAVAEFDGVFGLKVKLAGTGSGTVDVAPYSAGHTNWSCTSTECSGTSVGAGGGAIFTLEGTPAAHSVLTWSPACDPELPPDPAYPCEYDVLAPGTRTVTASFDLERLELSVTKQGSGSGTVASSPAGIDCGAACKADFDYGKTVNLTATPAAGSSFGGWGGDCSGSATVCTVTVGKAKTVTASFTATPDAGGGGSGGGGGGSGGGGGGSGGGGAQDTSVEAQLLAVRVTRSKLGVRLVASELEADEQVKVNLDLKRGTTLLAHRHLAAFDKTDGIVTLVVPQRIAKGSATLSITLTDVAGNAETLTRTVKLPAPRKPKQ